MSTFHGPSLRGMINITRKSNYTLTRSINEFIDNSIYPGQSNIVSIELNSRDDNTIYEIKIKDNGVGFENNKYDDEIEILKEAFRFTSDRKRENEDHSENGMGFKSGSINICGKYTCYTKVKDKK